MPFTTSLECPGIDNSTLLSILYNSVQLGCYVQRIIVLKVTLYNAKCLTLTLYLNCYPRQILQCEIVLIT